MEAYKRPPLGLEDDSPFLGLQAHSVNWRNQEITTTLPVFKAPKPLYQKPKEICRPVGSAILDAWDMRQTMEFCQEWRTRIEATVQSIGLEIRKMDDGDTPGILKFMENRYPPFHQKEVCAFDLFRWRNFGHGVVLADKSGNIQGTVFENGYDTPEKTSFTIRLAVAEKLSGNRLGYQVMLYSCLLAMEKGSRVKRGIIQCMNHRSLYINLNHVGWICDSLDSQVNGLGNFFHIALPLNPYSLVSNKVDPDKVPAYLATKIEGKDYKLIHANSNQGIEAISGDNKFKIVAFLRQNEHYKHPTLLALNTSLLEYKAY